MKVVRKKLSELKMPERNVRMHGAKQIAEFKRSVEMFGQIRPIVTDEDGVILAGNGLYETMLAMGREDADCYVVTGLTDKQKKKLMLADNRVYSLGVDDMAAFDAIIAELGDDLDIPGYDDDLLQSLVADEQEVDDIIAGYGIVSDNARANMERAQENYRAEEQAFAANAEEIHPAQSALPTDTAPAPRADAAEGAPSAGGCDTTREESPAETLPDPLPRRFIICPKCAEKIWL